MDEQASDGNAFAIPALWKASILALFDERPTDSTAFEFEPLNLQDEGHGKYAILQDLDLKLPNASIFNYGPIEDLGTLDTSSVLSSAESFETLESLDVWSFPLDLEEQEFPKAKSWDPFFENFLEPRTTYISGAGSQGSDAILAAQDSTEDGEIGRKAGCVIKSDALVSSLYELGLGRDSTLYRYNEQERSFVPLVESERKSGYSPEVVGSINATFIDYGNKTKRLQSFIDVTHTSSKSPSTSIAMAGSISAIIASIHAQIGDSSKSARNLLELSSLFERPGLVLSYLDDIVIKVGTADREEEVLTRLYDYVEYLEHSVEWIRPVLFQILASVSKPWLNSVSKWVGLKERTAGETHGHGLIFVVVREEMQRHEGGKEMKKLEYDFEHLSMPKFISEGDAIVIFETGKNLRLLETYRPEHPLSRLTQIRSLEAPDLQWQFSRRDAERIQLQAQQYESNLQKAIIDFNLNGGDSGNAHLHKKSFAQTEIATIGLSEETAKAYIHASIATFEKPLPDLRTERRNSSSPECIYNDLLQEEDFAPPFSLLPVLSFNPVIASQALLINRACLRLLFKEYNLPFHFSLLHRYILLGDGTFASRLLHTLFNPALDSADGRKGRFRAGGSGLKLGSRDTWPPASSELRLALMDILTESYHESGRGAPSSSMFRKELPGGLSFAIRDMPEDELQRCMNPDSIEALDFLRLQYRPPPPLDAVITQISLAKYDVIFKLLLRASRMLYVVNQLFRDTKPRFAIRHGADLTSTSFRIESHHFVASICWYFSNGVQANWTTLQRKLEDVDRALDRDGTSDGDSLHKLRDFHENLLDRLMLNLILRKRQAQAMKLLEELFSLILVFARHVRTEAAQEDLDHSVSKVDLKETYEMFRKKVRVFISVCRDLSERRGEGGTGGYDAGGESSEDGGDIIGQLLLEFEMNGFYAE